MHTSKHTAAKASVVTFISEGQYWATLGQDAIRVGDAINMAVHNLNDGSDVFVGFPKHAAESYVERMKRSGLNPVFVD